MKQARFTILLDEQPHDPLDPAELAQFRAWLAKQPLVGSVSVFAVCRLLATLDAELGLVAEESA